MRETTMSLLFTQTCGAANHTPPLSVFFIYLIMSSARDLYRRISCRRIGSENARRMVLVFPVWILSFCIIKKKAEASHTRARCGISWFLSFFESALLTKKFHETNRLNFIYKWLLFKWICSVIFSFSTTSQHFFYDLFSQKTHPSRLSPTSHLSLFYVTFCFLVIW